MNPSPPPASDPVVVGPTLQLTVNGQPRAVAAPMTCAGLLALLDLSGRRIACERNGEIVPRSRLADTLLADGDSLEIVVAVGGG